MKKIDKNSITLAKYLLTKGVESPLKIQKIMFFLRVEELKLKINNGFFKDSNNFQAWIYGPVNPESFNYMKKYFNNFEEKEMFLLDKDMINYIDQIYGPVLKEYINMSATDLIDKSHKNKSWINARGNLKPDEICDEYLIEDNTFIEFKDNEY